MKPIRRSSRVTLATLLAMSIVTVAQTAFAEASVRSIHRAEISHDGLLSLCVSGRPTLRSVETHYTLHADVRDLRTSAAEPGCGPRGGRRLAIGSGRPNSVQISGGAIVYVPASGGDGIRIAVGETSPAVRSPQSVQPASRGYTVRSAYPRLSEREGSSRIVVPGPRASEIGDVTAGAVLGGLEDTLDPVVEPALVVGLRATFAGAGAIIGAALYIPTTLLDVLCSEL